MCFRRFPSGDFIKIYLIWNDDIHSEVNIEVEDLPFKVT